MGQMWALAGSTYTAIVGWIVLLVLPSWFGGGFEPTLPASFIFVLVPLFLGFIGCQIDSILGALFENQGKLGKQQVNFLSILIATLLAGAILLVFA